MWLTTDEQSEAFWGYKDLLIFLGLAVPCLLGGSLLMKVALLAFYVSPPNKALELLPGQFLGYLLLYAALAALFRIEYDRPFWRSLGWRWPRLPLPAIVAAGMAMAFVIALLGALLKTPETPGPMKELLENRASLILVAIFGVTLGPLCEELAFRGFMQPLFIRSLGVAPGILLSGIGFGLLHLPQYGFTWQHGVLITVAGTAFGWMRRVSGSTFGSTLMHAAYNFTLFIGFFAGGNKVPQSW
jgi:membrane protease YdiL (CAAX protease family)